MSREDATLCRDNNISGGPNNSNVPSQNIALDLYLLEEHSDSKSLLLRQLTSYLKKKNVTTTLRGGRGTRDNAECENAHLLRCHSLGRKPNFDLTNVTYTALVATLLIYRMCSFAIVRDGTRKVVGWHAVPAYFDVFGGTWGIWPVTNTNLNKIIVFKHCVWNVWRNIKRIENGARRAKVMTVQMAFYFVNCFSKC